MAGGMIRLAYEPRTWQRWIHKRLQGKRRAVLICSRQIGKTYLAIAELITRVLQGPENSDSCYICPASTQARRIAWPVIKRQLAPLRQHCSYSETLLKVTLPGNRTIHLLGAESGDNIRGSSFFCVLCDERDSISDEFWSEVMIPTINAYGERATILYIGTLAGGASTLWDMRLRHSADPDWYCGVIDAKLSGCFSDDWLEEQRQAMSASAFLRELMCDPEAPVDNSVLGEQVAAASREGRVRRVPRLEGVPICTSWDLGIRDFTTVWMWQNNGRWVEYLAYREFQDLSIGEILGRLKVDYPQFLWGDTVLPHDAKTRDKTSGFAVEDIFYEDWPGPVHRFNTAPSPIATLQAARRIMPACVFDEDGCKLGIRRLKQARYMTHPKTGSVLDSILHDDASHCLDGFRYGAWWRESMHPGRAEPEDLSHLWEQDREQRLRAYS